MNRDVELDDAGERLPQQLDPLLRAIYSLVCGRRRS